MRRSTRLFVLLTGATRGLGRAMTEEFAALGHSVAGCGRSRKGTIVNLSSGWGRSVDADVAPYCAAKWAVEGLTRALAEELPRGMAAVALSPRMVNTDMLKRCFGTDADNYLGPQKWAAKAVRFILGIRPRDNGRSLTTPR